MAFLPINNNSQYVGRRGTLDRVATGVNIAANLLGMGLGTYKTFAAEIPKAQAETEAARAQTQYLQSETKYKQGDLAIRMAQMGFMPFDPSYISHPDLSSGSGAVQMQQGDTKVQTNQAHPNFMKAGDQMFIQVGNPTVWQEPTKNFVENMAKQGYMLTSDSDPDPTKRPYVVPGMPLPMNFKQMKLDPEKAATIEDQVSQAFLKDQNVQRFNNIDSAANMALHVMNKTQQNIPIGKPDDIALTISAIRAMNPDSNLRFNNENVEGFKGQITPGTDLLLEQLHKLYDPNSGLLPPEVRTQILGTIQKAYEAERPNYDRVVQTYQGTAQARGLNFTAPVLPNLFSQSPQSSVNPPGGPNGQLGARSLGAQSERSNANNPQFQPQFPQATPLSPAKSLLGIGQ